MQYSELTPAPPLDALVRCFWFLRGSAAEAAQPIVCDGRIEIVLHLAEPFRRIVADGSLQQQADVLVAGQLTAPLHVMSSSDADVVGIRFRTAAAAAVVRAPLSELTDRVESLADVAPKLARDLFAAAASSRDPHIRAAALSRVLLAAVQREPDALAHEAVRSLDAVNAARVAPLAKQLGVSARTLERRIAASTGIAPGPLRKALRFRRAFRLLDGSAPGTWAGVAAAAGYFDQAHLIRDFRQYAGASPTEFFGGNPELSRAISG